MRRLQNVLHSRLIALRHYWLPRFVQAARGQSLVEYALILSVVVIVVIGVLAATGDTLKTQWWDKISGIFT